MTGLVRTGGFLLLLALFAALLVLVADSGGPDRSSAPAPPVGETALDAPDPTPTQQTNQPNTVPERASLPEGPARLRIQVVDPEGLPVAGVPVGLARTAGERLDLRWSGKTAGEEGLVEVAGPKAERLGPGPLFALLLLPLGSLIQEEVDPDSPPPVPVRLRLPPMGQVRVRLEMEGVGPMPAQASLWIRYLVVGGPGPLDGIHHPTLRKLLEPGQTEWLFPWIGLGLDLEVHARSGSRCTAQQKGKGPTLPGETVCFSLTLPAFPVLVGRLLEKGAPVTADPDHPFQARWTAGEKELYESVRWDGQGRFRISLPPDCIGVSESSLRLWDALSPRQERKWLFAHAHLPQPLVPGENDLGDLALSQGGLLAGGRVVDQAGRPMPGVRIVLYERTSLPPAMATFAERLDLECRSGGDGSFRIPGFTEAAELFVDARQSDHPHPVRSRVVPPGTHGIELTLKRAWRLEGSILLDAGVPERAVALALECLGPRGSVEQAIAPVLHEDGRILASGYHGTSATLRVRLGGDREPTLVFQGLALIPGETTKDPRLQGIDLRGRLEPIEVALVFPGGSIPKNIQILCGPAFRLFGMRDVQLQSTGVFRYAVGKEPIDFVVATDAYPPHLIRGIAQDCRIVIDQGLEVLLSLTPGAMVPEPPFGLMALLWPAGASATPALSRGSLVPVAPFSPAGEARVRVAGPGSFELGLRLLSEGRPGREVKVSPARVEVAGGQAVILVTPDSESLARAMEPIGGPR